MKWFYLLLIGINSVVFTAQNQWSLQQCIDYAQKHNLTLKQNEISVEISKNNTTQTKASVLPSVNAGASHTYNFGRTIDRYTNTFANTQVLSQNFYLSTNVVLWSGLAQYNNIKANEYSYLSSKENLNQQKNDVALNVATAYLNVLYNDELLSIAKNQFAITKEQLERTEKLATAGSVAQSAVFDLKAQLANEEVNVISADNNHLLSLLTLTQFLNLDSVASFSVVKPNVDGLSDNALNESVQKIYESALKNQPSIKSAEFALLSAEKTLLASKGRMSPTLSLNASIGTGTSGLAKEVTGVNFIGADTTAITTGGDYVLSPRTQVTTRNIPFADQFKDNVNKSVGFTLNIPLFNGLQTYTSVKNAQLNALNTRYNQELTEQNLYKVIAQNYASANAALNKYKASKLSVEASEKAFTFAEQKFNLGAISAFDYNTAKTRLVTAQSNLLQAKYDYLFKLKVLDFYQGKPLTF